MRRDPAGLELATEGVTSNGVPFVALPPEGSSAAKGLVVLWHGADPPRTEAALAAAVPLRRLPAWRVYLGLPLYGQRQPAGGFDELMRRGAEDAVTLVFQPTIEGAVGELPAAVDDIRSRLRIDAELPLGIFGFSVGGAAALLTVAQSLLPFTAAVTFGATIDLPALVDAQARFFDMTYDWTDKRRAVAERLSATQRAGALAASGAAILLSLGEDDELPVQEPAERLAEEIGAAGGTAEVTVVPNVGHVFVDEPGDVVSPQGPPAQAVDALASKWFSTHLT